MWIGWLDQSYIKKKRQDKRGDALEGPSPEQRICIIGLKVTPIGSQILASIGLKGASFLSQRFLDLFLIGFLHIGYLGPINWCGILATPTWKQAFLEQSPFNASNARDEFESLVCYILAANIKGGYGVRSLVEESTTMKAFFLTQNWPWWVAVVCFLVDSWGW